MATVYSEPSPLISSFVAPIAIITVTYSPGEYLQKFLDSLAAATERETLVIMADNGSTDGVPQQAEKPGVEFHPTGGNIGYGSAVNYGVEQIRVRREAGDIDPDFFLIVNPDVVFSPGSIDRLLDVAHAYPRAGSVGPLIREADGSIYPSARAVPELGSGIGHALMGGIWEGNPWSRRYKQDKDMDRQRDAGWLSGSCLLMRWDAFDSVGGFDERYFMYMEDVDLGDRLGQAGWRNIFTPEAEISHAKGHAAGAHPELMLPAHHESAYRFQADRHPQWWQAPLRGGLWVGLKIRSFIAVRLAQRSRK